MTQVAWSEQDEQREVLAALREQIASELTNDDRIRVEAIAQTLRNVIAGGGQHARFALALVGAELAAE